MVACNLAARFSVHPSSEILEKWEARFPTLDLDRLSFLSSTSRSAIPPRKAALHKASGNSWKVKEGRQAKVLKPRTIYGWPFQMTRLKLLFSPDKKKYCDYAFSFLSLSFFLLKRKLLNIFLRYCRFILLGTDYAEINKFQNRIESKKKKRLSWNNRRIK